jgi:hypothetical protein
MGVLVKTGSNLPRRALAAGLVACVHLVVLLLLGWEIPSLVVPAPRDEGPVLEITLMPPRIRLRSEPAPEKAKPAPAPPAASARVLTQPTPQPLPAVATPEKTAQAPPQAIPAPVPPNVETNPANDNVRNALRGLIGCTGVLAARLSHEERQACDRKLAAATPAPVGPLYTAKEAQAFNTNPTKESIFVRKPHNECLPHIGNMPTPPGAGAVAVGSGKTTGFGLACEWDFW